MTVLTWNKPDSFNRVQFESAIHRSLQKMYECLKQSGLIYADTASQKEVDNSGAQFKLDVGDISLEVTISHDKINKKRDVCAQGAVGEAKAHGKTSTSYLLSPSELESALRTLRCQTVWIQPLVHENYYTVVCATK